MHGMTVCRRIVVATALLAPVARGAGAAAQRIGPDSTSAPSARSAPVPAPSPAAPAPAHPSAAPGPVAPLPAVPQPILREWIARVQHDSVVWAQCLRGTVGDGSAIVVAEVVEAVGQRIENGSLRYGCPAGSIGSAHSFTPGAGETCAASDSERDAFYAGWEQVRVLVCPGPRLVWLVRPARPATNRRVQASLRLPTRGA